MSAPLRFGLAATCFAHAAIFGWAASTLPWRSGTTFSVALTLLAVLHVATAVAALARKPQWLLWAWRSLSVASALAFVTFSWSMAAAALYVSKLYTKLGPSIASGILIAALVLALLTLPMAIWGGIMTLPAAAHLRRRLGLASLLLVLLAVLTLPVASSAARAEPVAHTDAQLVSRIGDVLEGHSQRKPSGKRLTVAGAGPATCETAVDAATPTLLVTYVNRRGRPRSDCVQGSARGVVTKLRRLLKRRARAGSTVVVDLVRAIKPLSPRFPLLDVLEVRPGVDGVCEDLQCLPAWQLTLGDSFAENRPIPSIPDATFGFSTESVRRLLDSKHVEKERGIEGFVRIESDSFVADESGVHRLVRTRTTPPALSAMSVKDAVAGAQRYILAAQKRDGSFRYNLDPTTGKSDQATLNLPRQAGTTYALCELGDGPALQRGIARALSTFEPTETNFGAFSALSNDAGGFGLGRSALPLLALLRCRDFVGGENDRLIGQLSRLLLKLQREDGSFFPSFDAKTKQGAGQGEILYAAGQAVLSLVLLEQQHGRLKGSAAEPLPDPALLKGRIDRAMDYYGGSYWPTPLRNFFFFEEGWHCLAARTALSSHRHDRYEQLCIDYVASRSRFLLSASDTSEPNFVGGYGMSDLFAPRNTATAGVGEALNAAIAIKQKRGLDVTADLSKLKDLVSFLLRAQWSQSGCYACRDPEQVAGGFSQQLASPGIRIDYVQHAMAAIGHGAKLLGLRE